MLTEFNDNKCKSLENNKFLSLVLGIYVILIGVGLPLAVRDQYFDILVFKYYYYCFFTILLVAVLVGYSLIFRTKDSVLYLRNFKLKVFLKKCTIVDYFVFIYLAVAIISTITSDYLFESFWGNEGRFTGLFLIIWYVAAYFLISRFWKFKSWYIDLILVSAMFACIFGITDYFQMDLLHFKVYLAAEQRSIFTSTFGNINTYTAYVGMIVAIATVLFTKETRFKYMVWYYICMVISFFAIIMGVSDNAYLSLGALFGFLPLYLFGDKKGVQRYLIIIATFFTVTQCIDWINTFWADRVLGIDSAFNMIIGFRGLHFLVIALWGFVIIWYMIDYKKIVVQSEFGNVLRYIWFVIIGLVLLAVSYIFYDCNIAGNADKYGTLSTYFLFNDEWGTHRGYIWRNAMECFNALPIWKKLVGFGPETFGILIKNKTAYNPYNELFDSAHNEYLHLLTTVGIAGLLAYLGIILSFIKNGIKHQINNPYGMAILFAVICYSTQAFVNLNLPIVTPILWLLLGMGASKTINNNHL